MAESTDTIMPMLREMRSGSSAMHERTQQLPTGEFEERIGLFERKVRAMEGRS